MKKFQFVETEIITRVVMFEAESLEHALVLADEVMSIDDLPGSEIVKDNGETNWTDPKEVKEETKPCRFCDEPVEARVWKEELEMCVECSHDYFDHKISDFDEATWPKNKKGKN